MFEVCEYKDVTTSSFGHQWVAVREFDREEEAREFIDSEVKAGKSRYDFMIRPAVKREEKKTSTTFRFKKYAPNSGMSASERKRRWNSKDPRDKI